MTTSLRKIHAIFNLKTKLLLTNTNVMVAPGLAIGMVVFMRLLFSQKLSPNFNTGFLMGFGLLFNIVMGGIMMTSGPLAEEKEKHTLRVLMTSSVTGLDYFIGSLCPPFLILMFTNLLIIPLAGAHFQQVPLGSYLVITTVTTVTSLLLGSLVGLWSHNQTQTSLLSLPLILIFTMAPSFQLLNSTLKHVVRYLYAGTVTQLADGIAANNFQWHGFDILVLGLWLGLSLVAVLLAYRKNGLDA